LPEILKPDNGRRVIWSDFKFQISVRSRRRFNVKKKWVLLARKKVDHEAGQLQSCEYLGYMIPSPTVLEGHDPRVKVKSMTLMTLMT
jgi:hypothetical protein